MKTFKENWRKNKEELITGPLVLIINASKTALEKTIGLDFLSSRLERFKPFGLEYDFHLPTITGQFVRKSRLDGMLTRDHSDHPYIGFGWKQFKGGILSLPLVPILYIASTLGKLVGAALALPLLLFTAPYALIKTAAESKRTEKTAKDRASDYMALFEPEKANPSLKAITETAGQAEKEENKIVKWEEITKELWDSMSLKQRLIVAINLDLKDEVPADASAKKDIIERLSKLGDKPKMRELRAIYFSYPEEPSNIKGSLRSMLKCSAEYKNEILYKKRQAEETAKELGYPLQIRL